ncbi:MAG: fluoride efflux transporter CrcB [Candidatus Melainabacteria bacterium]|nr:fluoride efflux transporter CrcB [Candidatus Melainabacteria bacterium]
MPSFEQLSFPGLKETLAVAAGGLFGSVFRYLTGHFAAQLFGTTFPWGTLIVNGLGTSLLAFVVTLAFNKPGTIDPGLRFFLTTGFAGGFTTFSALAMETFSLYQKGEVVLATANLGGNLLLGLVAVVIGFVLARLI